MQYNPYLTQAYMQQNRPTYAVPTPEPQPQPYFGIKGRPVASIEEARAMSIDFDGSIFYFPDLANRKIYTKQINMDGTASLNVYELKEIPTAIETDISNYITRAEFEEVVAQLKNMLQPAPAAAPEVKLNF